MAKLESLGYTHCHNNVRTLAGVGRADVTYYCKHIYLSSDMAVNPPGFSSPIPYCIRNQSLKFGVGILQIDTGRVHGIKTFCSM